MRVYDTKNLLIVVEGKDIDTLELGVLNEDIN